MKRIKERDFEKIDLRAATIKAVKRHPKTKDYVLLLDMLPIERPDVQVIANLKDGYTMKELLGKQVCVVRNIANRTIRGIECQGCILVAYENNKPVLIRPAKKVKNGVKLIGLTNVESYHHNKPGEGC